MSEKMIEVFEKAYQAGMAEHHGTEPDAARRAAVLAVLAAVFAQRSVSPITDRELYDNSCITRHQLKTWIDSDYVTHVGGLKHTIEFLLSRLDALSPLPSTERECGLCGGPLPCLTHSQGLPSSSLPARGAEAELKECGHCAGTGIEPGGTGAGLRCQRCHGDETAPHTEGKTK